MEDLDIKLLNVLLSKTEAITESNIVLDFDVDTAEEVVQKCGEMLKLTDEFVESLFYRYKRMQSYVGGGFAIIHIDKDMRKYYRKNKIVFIRLKNEVKWNDRQVRCVFGVATTDVDHMYVMGGLARLILDDESREIFETENVEKILGVLTNSRNTSIL